jgi:hypothetical protein
MNLLRERHLGTAHVWPAGIAAEMNTCFCVKGNMSWNTEGYSPPGMNPSGLLPEGGNGLANQEAGNR